MTHTELVGVSKSKVWFVTPGAHARSGVKQWVLSVSQCVSQCVIKSLADHDNEGSKHFSTSFKQWK